MDLIKKYAVAGFPVSHSKSPLIFNRLFSITGSPGMYTRISTSSREEASEMFTSLGLTGMNITTPLKAGLMKTADNTDEAAEQIGCINTLFNHNGIMKGFNTDHLGVSGSLSGEEITAKEKKCLVLGAGNAGRAAVYALKKMGGDVTVINRTYKRAHALAADMDCNAQVIEKLHSELSDCDIFVSTITGGTDVIRKNWLKEETVVFDANYLHSPLQETAISAGCRFIPGETWLWNQAAPVFRIFAGTEINPSAAEEVRRLLDKPPLPVSGIRLAGEEKCIEAIKKEILEQKLDLEIEAAGSDGEFTGDKVKKKVEGRTFKILIYSGNREKEKIFFPGADLVVWGRDGASDCSRRIMKEISRVR